MKETEQQKQWNKIKFYASKWRELENKEKDIRMQIIKLEVEAEQYKKDAKLYMIKTRSTILLEVV